MGQQIMMGREWPDDHKRVDRIYYQEFHISLLIQKSNAANSQKTKLIAGTKQCILFVKFLLLIF